MASAVQTSSRQVLPPPLERYTILGWLKKNLFDGWFNSFLTVLVVFLLYSLLRPLSHWVFNTAEWEVIPANFNLIMRGQYPVDQAWRLWLVVYLLAFVIGFAWAANTKRIQGQIIALFSVPLLLMLVPFFDGGIRASLLVVEAAGLIGFGIGWVLPQKYSRFGVYALFIYTVAMLLILRGGASETGLMPAVPTSLWGGLLLSLLLAVFGIVISFPLGVLLALGRQSNLPAIRMMSVLYIEFIRGVPLISLLFMAQVMLQLFLPDGFPTIDRALRALAAVTLFSAAYTAENVRGGLQSIPKGQYEAANALGLNTFQSMTYIILPQALRAVIPVLVGQFIGLFKDTSLVALVGLFDLMGIARTILGNPNWLGTHREVYAFVGLLYWIFSYMMAYTSRRIEAQMAVGNQ